MSTLAWSGPLPSMPGTSRRNGTSWKPRWSMMRRKPSTADVAVADVLVAVAAAAQLDLRVVGVHGDELVEADLLLELGHRQLEALGAGEVVAGRVGVLRVEADLDAVAADLLDDAAEVGEARADGAAGAGASSPGSAARRPASPRAPRCRRVQIWSKTASRPCPCGCRGGRSRPGCPAASRRSARTSASWSSA